MALGWQVSQGIPSINVLASSGAVMEAPRDDADGCPTGSARSGPARSDAHISLRRWMWSLGEESALKVTCECCSTRKHGSGLSILQTTCLPTNMHTIRPTSLERIFLAQLNLKVVYPWPNGRSEILDTPRSELPVDRCRLTKPFPAVSLQHYVVVVRPHGSIGAANRVVSTKAILVRLPPMARAGDEMPVSRNDQSFSILRGYARTEEEAAGDQRVEAVPETVSAAWI
jgi:hypothetical protein